jgi:hypothetical protein
MRPYGAPKGQPFIREPVIRRERKPCKGVTRCKRLRVPPLQGWCTPHHNSQGVALGYRIGAPLGRQFRLEGYPWLGVRG